MIKIKNLAIYILAILILVPFSFAQSNDYDESRTTAHGDIDSHTKVYTWYTSANQ